MNNLRKTLTLTVRLTGAPTPLSAVQRYVPFALLWILLRTCFPSTTGSRGALSVPLSSSFVHVMVGVGLPVALQLKVTKEPSQTTWSLLTLAITGGTAKIRDILKQLRSLQCSPVSNQFPISFLFFVARERRRIPVVASLQPKSKVCEPESPNYFWDVNLLFVVDQSEYSIKIKLEWLLATSPAGVSRILAWDRSCFRLRTMNPTPASFPGFEYSSHLLY